MYLFVCALCMCILHLHVDILGGHQVVVTSPETEDVGSLSCYLLLGTKSRSSERVTSHLNCWAKSSAPRVILKHLSPAFLDVSWNNHKRAYQSWRVESLQWKYNRRSERLCVCKVQWPPSEVHGESAVLHLSESVHFL